ncbi:hypothetical protein [Chelativorans salis]|uniref:CopL family metal-binding regulatory protein n=1 Tax=Chelativorans salis TaxID=2978478 RepID=A0ABT2LKX3_9HYPH|nr:hypothetical protein [Chelativorans sp. EGI FJ00035]MCT7374926.1 hypothetical protein [Chelativorans sp. EGI FJ00035]
MRILRAKGREGRLVRLRHALAAPQRMVLALLLVASMTLVGGLHAHEGTVHAALPHGHTAEAHVPQEPCEDRAAGIPADGECCVPAAGCGLFLAHEAHPLSFRAFASEQDELPLRSLDSISPVPEFPPPRPARS